MVKFILISKRQICKICRCFFADNLQLCWEENAQKLSWLDFVLKKSNIRGNIQYCNYIKLRRQNHKVSTIMRRRKHHTGDEKTSATRSDRRSAIQRMDWKNNLLSSFLFPSARTFCSMSAYQSTVFYTKHDFFNSYLHT